MEKKFKFRIIFHWTKATEKERKKENQCNKYRYFDVYTHTEHIFSLHCFHAINQPTNQASNQSINQAINKQTLPYTYTHTHCNWSVILTTIWFDCNSIAGCTSKCNHFINIWLEISSDFDIIIWTLRTSKSILFLVCNFFY